LSTGRTFEVTGAERATLDVPAGRPPLSWQPGFALAPDGPPIRLALELTYDELGRLADLRELRADGSDHDGDPSLSR
jgi:hypothetical protein